ncbi:hypothetical protein MnTg02_01402 [bacterium MnTg02]|nr:hypothetical protein MnTg02_01402 [bacterium MnTg02]
MRHYSIFNEFQFTKSALALCFYAFAAWKSAHIPAFAETCFSAKCSMIANAQCKRCIGAGTSEFCP